MNAPARRAVLLVHGIGRTVRRLSDMRRRTASGPTGRRGRTHRSAAWIGPLVLGFAAAAAGPAAAAPAGSGVYLSDAVELVLRADGTFAVQELGGSRQARGRYRLDGDSLVFLSGDGDVGRTRFPLTCRVAASFDGFAVSPGQPRCRAFDGLSFRVAR